MNKTPTERKTKKTAWVDPDDAPELTDERFRKAEIYHGGVLISRGERTAADEIAKKSRPLAPKK